MDKSTVAKSLIRSESKFVSRHWLAGMTPTRLAHKFKKDRLWDTKQVVGNENTYRKNGTQTKAIS